MIESGFCRRAENTERTGQSGGGMDAVGRGWSLSGNHAETETGTMDRGNKVGREEGDAASCQRGGKVCVEMRDETGACQAGG